MTTVTDVLSRFDEKIALLATQLRTFLLKELKEITETPDNAVNIIGYGYGTGYKDLICTIMLSKQGIKLGFNKGSELPDPQKLLTGTGKVHRFVEIKSQHDIRSAALKKMISEALKAYERRKSN